MYWLSLVLIGLPIFYAIGAVHERVMGSAPGTLVGWLYVGVALGTASIGRFLVQLVWDAVELSARRR